MNNTKNARIKDIRKVFKRKWPEYRVVGNYSHDKGVLVIKKATIPIITQTFEKNYDLFKAILNPIYHPGKSIEKIKGIPSLFGTSPSEKTSKAHMRNLLNKFTSFYLAAQDIGEVFNIDLSNKPLHMAQKAIKEKLK